MDNRTFPPAARIFLEPIERYGLGLWRRAWLVFLLAALGALAGYLYSAAQTPQYASSVRVMVVRPANETIHDLTFWMWNAEIAQNYAQIAQGAGFSETIMARAGGRIGFIGAFAAPDTQFIYLTVTTPDASAAVPLLDAAVDVLDEELLALQAERYRTVEESLDTQIESAAGQVAQARASLEARYAALAAEEKTRLEGQIFDLENQLAVLRAAASPNPQQVSQAQTRLTAARQLYFVLLQTNRIPPSRDAELTRLERELALYQGLYDRLLSEREGVRLLLLDPPPVLLRVEEPFEPLQPVSPRTRRNTGLAGMAGLAAGLLLALALEFLSDTLKSPEALRQRLAAPLLGQVPEHRPGALLALEADPASADAEAYRILRTNLAFCSVDRALRVIQVTSPGRGEGKTLLAANLAAALSQLGRRVLLVDANLRQPGLHLLLGLDNRQGLSAALLDPDGDIPGLAREYRGANNVHFSVLTSGPLPPNPAETLESGRMAQFIEKAAAAFDVVVFDSTALFLPDAQILAARMDGVLLAARAGHTRFDTLHGALETLKRSRAHLAGLVLTRQGGKAYPLSGLK
jgi:capsular exopolysaccharide synthesis family protein